MMKMFHNYRKIIVRGSLWLILLSFILFTAELVFAQNWVFPLNNPPVNNPGQPPDLGSDYWLKSATVEQVINGPVGFIGSIEPFKTYIGNPLAANQSASILALDNLNAIDVPSLGRSAGLYAASDEVGMIAWVNTVDADPNGFGVVGKSNSASGYGARFYGPVYATYLESTSQGKVLVSTVNAKTASCNSSDCTPILTPPDYWLQSTVTGIDARALSATSTVSGVPAVDININRSSATGFTIIVAISGQYGISGHSQGLSKSGVYAIEQGTEVGVGGFYTGIYGLTSAVYDVNAVQFGVFGETKGGVGIDGVAQMAAGVRACNDDGSGPVIHGVGTGTGYAAYFIYDEDPVGLPNDGKILLLGSSRLCVGNICLSKENLTKLRVLAGIDP